MIFTTLVSLLAVLVVANGSPLQPQQLDVITPHITSPTEAVSWAPGSCQNVTWETKNIPPASRNNSGMILLGHMTETYDAQGRPQPNENLNISSPLATHFSIGTGCQQVIIPRDTIPRDDYFVVLFGDSGNCSPKFKIRK